MPTAAYFSALVCGPHELFLQYSEGKLPKDSSVIKGLLKVILECVISLVL